MEELLEELSQTLSAVNPNSNTLEYGDPKSKEFREGLAELRKHSGNLLKDFPHDPFPLVAGAVKELSNHVNVLVADFPGVVAKHKQALESIKTIWFLKVRPEIYRVEMALAVVAGVLLPEDPSLFRGKDKYIREVVFEINRCYRNGAYNGCSVLMRRLIETLIIQAHEKAGNAAAAQNPTTGRFYKLEKLIDDIVANNLFGLSRNAIGALPELKRLGDWGAHNRNILIRESDIDRIKTESRLCFEELLRCA